MTGPARLGARQRGISAHSNGFQTARALHVLQILHGRVETPGGMRLSRPTPSPPAHPNPTAPPPRPAARRPAPGLVHGPDDLRQRKRPAPASIDKALHRGKTHVGPMASGTW